MSHPRLIFLPGMHGTASLFEPILKTLPVDRPHRVIQYPTNELLSYDQLLQRLEKQLGDEPQMILIAESFGGPLALKFAVKNHDRVRAVILCASFVRPPFPSWMRRLACTALFRLPVPPAAIRFFLAGPDASHHQVDEIQKAVREPSAAVLSHRIQSALTVDCSETLRQCLMPILCICPNQDRLLRFSSLKHMLAARSDLCVHRLDGPHMILQAAPLASWAAIERFLE